ncbi:MAG: class I SAM-dependent methyltransferase, partial [Balneolales bacterium]
LPGILKKFNIDKLIDAPCGDFSWMQHIDLPVTSYLGADIVPELISVNEKKFSDEQRNFIYLDLIQEPLPAADLLFCRDCLVHFSFTDIERFILNLKRSEISYLLTTTFTECTENEDITTGDWRVLNLEKEPFNLPSPLYILNEECNEGGGAFKDKSIGLWKIRDIPDPNPYV